MNFLSMIEAKRDGRALDAAQIKEMIASYTAGKIPDYQMSAFLMATFFRGLNDAETTALTLAMRDSGDRLEFPPDSRPLVDKHSTGGVGDKASLPLAPLLACLGFRVPMISGRGLGITGGTLDKLDSIPGFQTALPSKRIVEIVQEVGCVICGQTDKMAPADKALYALRDVTGTVASIPLIVASILSKKLAEGLQALILDVKCGEAAFMRSQDRARELALALVKLGNACNVNTRALITKMDSPLGRAAGNWVEVKESMACLSGAPGNDSSVEDLREVVLLCAAHLLVQTGKENSLARARAAAEDCLNSGAPRKKWDEMIMAQGADLGTFERQLAKDHTAAEIMEVKTAAKGYVSRDDARMIGEVVRDLGGGRLTKESTVNYEVGLDRLAKIGDKVERGATLARVHAATRGEAESACARLLAAFEISDTVPERQPVLIDTIISP